MLRIAEEWLHRDLVPGDLISARTRFQIAAILDPDLLRLIDLVVVPVL